MLAPRRRAVLTGLPFGPLLLAHSPELTALRRSGCDPQAARELLAIAVGNLGLFELPARSGESVLSDLLAAAPASGTAHGGHR